MRTHRAVHPSTAAAAHAAGSAAEPHAHRFPARHLAQLTVTGVSLARGGRSVLTELDLTVSPGSRVAVVGENGRGKSTLLHVLSGRLTPDAGAVRRTGTLGLAEQEMPAGGDRRVGDAIAAAIAPALAALRSLDEAAAGLSCGTPAADERYAAALAEAETLDAWDAERRIRIALDALGAESDHDRRLSELSVGQRYRIRLACLLGAEDDFLLLDEPTNHLDRGGLDFLTAQLRERPGGVVLVSHDRALLTDVAETILDLDPASDGRARLFGGGYAGYRSGRAAERERWEQAFERQRAEQARLNDSLSAAQNRLVSGWRPEKGTNKHGRATRAGGLVQSVHRRQEALDAHEVTVPEPPLRFRFPEVRVPVGRTLLRGEAIGVAGRLDEVPEIELERAGRLVVTGPNGAGKSTLLAVLAGELTPDTGVVRTAPGARIGVLRQEGTLDPARRAQELFAAHRGALIAAGTLPESEAVGLSSLGLLRPAEAGTRVGELSTGQQRRLELALVLAARPQLLLLDEPTNHLSMMLVDELTEALGATEAAVLLSSHDRQLLRDVADWPTLRLTPVGSLAN